MQVKHPSKLIQLAACSTILLILVPGICTGNPIQLVISTSPSWDSFTNRDGTGLYHEILYHVFAPHQIKVIHKYTNAKRGIHMVQTGQADFYTCRSEVDDFPDLFLGRYQMYEGKFYAIFKKNRIPDWQGNASLAGRKVAWRRGYYTASEMKADIIVREVDSGRSALGQLIMDRVDFYVDDLNLINESMSKSEFPVSRGDYRIEPVGRRTYHPVFKKNSRGKIILDLYDRGMEHLHRSGKLRQIFDKWGHPYPAYEIP